jgi:hypothetical protein
MKYKLINFIVKVNDNQDISIVKRKVTRVPSQQLLLNLWCEDLCLYLYRILEWWQNYNKLLFDKSKRSENNSDFYDSAFTILNLLWFIEIQTRNQIFYYDLFRACIQYETIREDRMWTV